MTRTGTRSRSHGPARARPWLSKKDLLVALGLPPLALISWVLPPSLWRGFARRLGPLYGPGRGAGPRGRLIQRIEAAYAPGRGARWLEAALREVGEEQILHQFEVLRDYRPGGWVPRIGLSGLEHVEAARAARRGAILWLGHFAHVDLVPKMAFHEAGLALAHLSHPRHGFSSTTRFGTRVLNPIKRTVEDRYLGARVMLEPAGTAAAMADLAARLRDNQIVSIVARGTALRPLTVPFLGGEIELAAGAPRLAYASGAALLPAFPVRNRSGGFTVFVEPPLEIDRSSERRAAVAAAARAYAKVLERYVSAYPGQWLGWFQV